MWPSTMTAPEPRLKAGQTNDTQEVDSGPATPPHAGRVLPRRDRPPVLLRASQPRGVQRPVRRGRRHLLCVRRVLPLTETGVAQ